MTVTTERPRAPAPHRGAPRLRRDHALLTVLEARPGCTVQDAGRRGYAHLGVPRSGPADRRAHALANRLVGNHDDAPALEVTLGGLQFRLSSPRTIAVTGAPVTVHVDGVALVEPRRFHVPAGGVVRLGSPATGLRSYVAVAGGVRTDTVLGSMSRDSLTGTGPEALTAGSVLELPAPTGPVPAVPLELTGARPAPSGITVRFRWGPRDDLFDLADRRRLTSLRWTVSTHCDRVGVRLVGEPLQIGELGLPSEGMPLGAIQVPPSGEPIIFLADHPVTGGYPVIGVVREHDLGDVAQLRPGDTLRLTAST